MYMYTYIYFLFMVSHVTVMWLIWLPSCTWTGRVKRWRFRIPLQCCSVPSLVPTWRRTRLSLALHCSCWIECQESSSAKRYVCTYIQWIPFNRSFVFTGSLLNPCVFQCCPLYALYVCTYIHAMRHNSQRMYVHTCHASQLSMYVHTYMPCVTALVWMCWMCWSSHVVPRVFSLVLFHCSMYSSVFASHFKQGGPPCLILA